MTSHEYRQTTFSPRMYPEEADTTRPVPPVRAEFQSNPQEEALLPHVPPRMDQPGQTSTISRQKECSCNYNRYATKKTIGHGLLEFALLTSNAMQLRQLLAQKQRDGIWVASLILVCISILAQLILAYILVVVGKGDIQNPDKQSKLEKYNNIALFFTMLISAINVIINAFMTSTNPTNYLDASALQALNKSI